MSRGVILVRGEIDRFQHNRLFADELVAAFAARGCNVRVVDYLAESKTLLSILREPECRFVLTFNGFGSEIEVPTGRLGTLDSAFEAFNKPLFDLMHDCPAHETMGHALRATYAQRHILGTDYTYAGIAQQLGVRDVTFVPSVTFPVALADTGGAERDIDALLAIGTSPPEPSRERIDRSTARGRLYRAVFDEVIEGAITDWSFDPIHELRHALRELGVAFDPNLTDHRFLLSVVLDYVKFARRRALCDALAGLPITLVPDRGGSYPKSFRVRETTSAKGLLGLMARSRIVVCPTTHITGYHERPLCAFTASAAVVSAPNRVLDAAFTDGTDIAFGRNAGELRMRVEALLADPDVSVRMGRAGHERAMVLYHPARLVSTILNRLPA